MAEATFSLIVWTHDTELEYFKNLLESIDEQEYREFELYILDEDNSQIESIIKEFFPDIVDKVHYRRLKNKKGGAYAINAGVRYSEGDYVVFLGQHDRLNPNTLSEFKERIDASEAGFDGIIYTDHDELVELDRMNPHFKGGLNKELLLHTNYIGEFVCISKEVLKQLGTFNEKASSAYIYEYLLRAVGKNIGFLHIPSLLYHKRHEKSPFTKEERKRAAYVQKEHMAIARAYLEKDGVAAEFQPNLDFKKWDIDYDSTDFRRFGGDYIYLHEESVKLYTRHNVEYMYGFLKQKDVAVVGVRFMDSLFTINNIGYIYDEEGIAYPAFYGQKTYQQSYEDLAKIPRDVSFVDAGCCLIDAKVYRMLRGFDTSLSGRDAMLDFCIRARKKGYRTVVVPRVVARNKKQNNESLESSHQKLIEKHEELISKGDLYYNRNLPLDTQNYRLPGFEE